MTDKKFIEKACVIGLDRIENWMINDKALTCIKGEQDSEEEKLRIDKRLRESGLRFIDNVNVCHSYHANPSFDDLFILQLEMERGAYEKIRKDAILKGGTYLYIHKKCSTSGVAKCLIDLEGSVYSS